jgi:hypothetical protein
MISRIRIQRALGRILAWTPNVLVFAVLAGIGWWGHTYHWTLPGRSPSHAVKEPSPDRQVNSSPADRFQPGQASPLNVS